MSTVTCIRDKNGKRYIEKIFFGIGITSCASGDNMSRSCRNDCGSEEVQNIGYMRERRAVLLAIVGILQVLNVQLVFVYTL